jgi:hypothetical protein
MGWEWCDIQNPTLVRPRTCGMLASPLCFGVCFPMKRASNDGTDAQIQIGYNIRSKGQKIIRRTSPFLSCYCYSKTRVQHRNNQVFFLFGGSSRISKQNKSTCQGNEKAVGAVAKEAHARGLWSTVLRLLYSVCRLHLLD